MPIVVNSPFSGKPVKIRDQDIGRAVRDEENRIFYVLARSDGNGYYSSPTRQGGAKDEARYIEMEQKVVKSGTQVREEVQTMHDATGRKRSGLRGKLLILIFLGILTVAAWWVFTNRDKIPWQKGPPSNPVPLDQSPDTSN